MIKIIIIYPSIDRRIDGIGTMKLKSQFVKKFNREFRRFFNLQFLTGLILFS